MFKKKLCTKCGNKIREKHDFCPYCGNQLKNNQEEEGMLGKNDLTNEFEQFSNSLFGGVGGKIIGGMLGRTMKMLEKEMQNQNSAPRTNFELIINGKRIDPKNIKVSHQPMQRQMTGQQTKKVIQKIPLQNLSEKNIKKISTLPKQEPTTNIRRLADKVIYEIEIPEVKSIEDVSINQLENSIEIKAIASEKVYVKQIPINLPIINYELSQGKLILELGVKN
jgi:HSP20 family molecular chaperone IbpA